MKTIYVGMKEFRANLAKFSAESSKKNQSIILFKNNAAMYEFRPLSKKEREEKEFDAAMARAEDDIRNGRVSTSQEVMARLKKLQKK